ncbi:MAG TPA: MarR family winged helix-turn-helix transcriptional regulator [Thermodesulfobacteriota bacterium]|nr:MarR family winged helix-turn-helix transcriptional regulator [Thermodesulfobacteriota bacterium]
MDQTGRIASLIERLGNLLRAEERNSGTGLMPVHVQMLSYLSICNRYSDTPAAVTEFSGATKGTSSQSIAVLERKGFLRKRPDKADGRAIHLDLTAKGRRFVENNFPPPGFGSAIEDMKPGDSESLARLLTGLLTTLQRRNRGRMFGVCRTCRHFRKDALPGSHQCGLTLEPLTEDESMKICREHERPAA